MGRTALVTVPDEGAAWTVRDALAAEGVTCEVERVGLENPYMASALARQMRIFVPDDQLAEARRLLAALEGEVANQDDDLTAQALAAGEAADAPTPSKPAPKLSWALALGLLFPIPYVCFYAGIRWLGLIFLVIFLVGGAFAVPELEDLGLRAALESWSATTVLAAAKAADLLLGLGILLARPRGRAG
jgi:hypothetical protein